MKTTILATIASATLLFAASCRGEAPINPTALSAEAVSFDSKLCSSIAIMQGNSNVCISPFAVAYSLGLIKPGAAGETATLMQAIPGMPATLAAEVKKAGIPFDYASILYLNAGTPINPEFGKTIPRGCAGMAPFSTNPAKAIEIINKWGLTATRNRIKSFLPPDMLASADTANSMLLLSAAHLNAKWKHAFDKGRNAKKDFTLTNNQSIKVETMCMRDTLGEKLRYATPSWAEIVVSMPYQGKGDHPPMLVLILPQRGTTPESIIKDFTPQRMIELKTAIYSKPIPDTSTEIFVELPKFEVSGAQEINSALTDMGMGDLFKKGTANFSSITPPGANEKHPIFVGLTYQHALLRANEEKTESSLMGRPIPRTSSATQTYAFNRPFVFMVIDTTDTPAYFIGIIRNPTIK